MRGADGEEPQKPLDETAPGHAADTSAEPTAPEAEKKMPSDCSEACTSRTAVVGDKVCAQEAKCCNDSAGNEDAWKLLLGEAGRVTEVDEDGDFRLANPSGLESTFFFKADFFYQADPLARALAAFKAAVEEVRTLKEKEDEDEAAMHEAKAQLATAMKAAILAGVSQAELVAASKGPAAEEDEDERLKPGDQVEVFGLESESGKQLNGQTGVIRHFIEDKGRFQIQLESGSFVSVRPANLRREAPSGPDNDDSEIEREQRECNEREVPMQVGSRVEIIGLESESGMKLNGKVGFIVELIIDKGRLKVEHAPGEFVSVREANLIRRPSKRASPGSDDDGGSSSSSSPEERKKVKKARTGGFSGGSPARETGKKSNKAKKEGLTADDGLDILLGNVSEQKALQQKKERRAGAEAAAAAVAAAAAADAKRAARPLQPGDRAEVHGLQSASGRKLNGKTGIVKRFIEAKGRWEVELGQAAVQSLKPENLKKVATNLGGGFASGQSSGGGAVNNEYSGPSAGYCML